MVAASMLVGGVALVACTVAVSGTGPSMGDAGADATRDDVSTGPLEGGEVPDAAEPADVGLDSPTELEAQPPPPPVDGAPPCPGVLCNGACMNASDCSSCAGATLLCASQHACMSGCAACRDSSNAPEPIECFACDSTHANPLGTCEPADASSYCLSGDYFGSYKGGAAGYHCGCPSGDAGQCPGDTQICATIGAVALCVTCGEPVPGNPTGKACKEPGTTCNTATHACQ
jgi:hypothetical protein